jgi:hypothetical protein
MALRIFVAHEAGEPPGTPAFLVHHGIDVSTVHHSAYSVSVSTVQTLPVSVQYQCQYSTW